MERRLTTTKSQLKLKVPEIEKTLDMVVLLKKKTVFLFIFLFLNRKVMKVLKHIIH